MVRLRLLLLYFAHAAVARVIANQNATAIAELSPDQLYEARKACVDGPFTLELFPTVKHFFAQNAWVSGEFNESEYRQQMANHDQAYEAFLAQGLAIAQSPENELEDAPINRRQERGALNTVAQIVEIWSNFVDSIHNVIEIAEWMAKVIKAKSDNFDCSPVEGFLYGQPVKIRPAGSCHTEANREELQRRLQHTLQCMSGKRPKAECIGIDNSGAWHASASIAGQGASRPPTDGECSSDPTFYECFQGSAVPPHSDMRRRKTLPAQALPNLEG